MLSTSVAEAFSREEDQRLHETERFVRMMDKFFDCMNVRDFNEAVYKRKPDLRPYRSPNDSRLSVSEESCTTPPIINILLSVAGE